jgi:group I intron endonuclease
VNGIVYHAFDTSNGKAYVGQAGSTLEKRKAGHLRFTKNLPFTNALRKRPEAFVWTVLTSGLTTQAELDEAEIYWGTFFDCLVPNGYNLKLGSGHVIWSDEEKARQSIRLTGKKQTPETIAKRVATLKGMKMPGVSKALLGKPKTEQHRENISKGRRGKPNGHEGKKQSSEWIAARVASRLRNKKGKDR